MKKIIILVMAVITLGTCLIPVANNAVYADEIQTKSTEVYVGDISLPTGLNQSLPTISPRAVGVAIAVFVAGLLAGYVIDGVLIYTTKVSAGAWVAKAIRYVANYPKTKSVRFSSANSNASGGGAF